MNAEDKYRLVNVFYAVADFSERPRAELSSLVIHDHEPYQQHDSHGLFVGDYAPYVTEWSYEEVEKAIASIRQHLADEKLREKLDEYSDWFKSSSMTKFIQELEPYCMAGTGAAYHAALQFDRDNCTTLVCYAVRDSDDRPSYQKGTPYTIVPGYAELRSDWQTIVAATGSELSFATFDEMAIRVEESLDLLQSKTCDDSVSDQESSLLQSVVAHVENLHRFVTRSGAGGFFYVLEPEELAANGNAYFIADALSK